MPEIKGSIFIGQYGAYRHSWKTCCYCSSYQEAKTIMEDVARCKQIRFDDTRLVWDTPIDWKDEQIDTKRMYAIETRSDYKTEGGQKRFAKMRIAQVTLNCRYPFISG